jgi:uncharacterized cupin superfamily protein
MIMKRLLLPIALVAAPAYAEPPAHPVKLSSAEAESGAIFAAPGAVTHVGKAGNTTHWYEMMASPDSRMSVGTYSSTAVRSAIAAYAETEFMLFLKGGVTLTSADGTVLEVKAGDAVVIPKGWKGVWDTRGYTKFYVTYDPDAPPRK